MSGNINSRSAKRSPTTRLRTTLSTTSSNHTKSPDYVIPLRHPTTSSDYAIRLRHPTTPSNYVIALRRRSTTSLHYVTTPLTCSRHANSTRARLHAVKVSLWPDTHGGGDRQVRLLAHLYRPLHLLDVFKILRHKHRSRHSYTFARLTLPFRQCKLSLTSQSRKSTAQSTKTDTCLRNSSTGLIVCFFIFFLESHRESPIIAHLAEQEVDGAVDEDGHLLAELFLDDGLRLAAEVGGRLADSAQHEGVALVGHVSRQLAPRRVDRLALRSSALLLKPDQPLRPR